MADVINPKSKVQSRTAIEGGLNVERAKSVLWFGCPGVACTCGDFDLSGALAKAVAGRRKVATGELRCGWTRKHGDREPVACGTVLRF